jgi:phosphohistidine phosphatase
MILTFLRHAHADPARDDKNRVLSPKGIEQALTFRKRIKGINYDLIIHSSAVRTRETADIMFYGLEPIPYVEIPTLYLPEDDKDIQEVSKAIMLFPYASPNEILKKDKNNAWERYTNKAYQDIESCLNDRQCKNALIIGHGTVINLLGNKFSPEFKGIKERSMGHLEGFSLRVGL